jgi:hypothetical protein
MPTIKERLENNIVIVVSATAIAAFSAGFGAHAAISSPPPQTSGASSTDWQSAAKQNGWIDKNACPAIPVKLRLASPGDGATVKLNRGASLESALVISASQPLPSADELLLVLKAEGDANYYVIDPLLNGNENRTMFRYDSIYKVPFKLDKQTHIDIWAVMIVDKRNLGSVYGSLDQITAVSNTIVLSEKVAINAVPE